MKKEFLIREDFKKNGKENDIVQKGGGVSEKYQILNVLLKVTFYLGRGLDQNQASVKFWGNSESGNSGERLV